MRNLLALFALILLLSLGITSHAKTPDGKTPAEETVCDGQKGAAYGLCNAYCEAMDCDNPDHKASQKACDKVLANYVKKTGESPPCDLKNCDDVIEECSELFLMCIDESCPGCSPDQDDNFAELIDCELSSPQN